MADARKPAWKRDPSAPPRDHYKEVTDKIVAALEAGVPPWKKPWDPEKTGGPQTPMNPTTGKRYRGINTLILGMDPRAFASGAYAEEELWAEFASVFLAAELGIPSEIPQHASYMQSWLKALKNDKREIFRAASDAQKITSHCLNYHPEYRATMAAEAVEVKEGVEIEADAPAVVAAPAGPDLKAAPERATAPSNAAHLPNRIPEQRAASEAAFAPRPPTPALRTARGNADRAEPGMRPR